MAVSPIIVMIVFGFNNTNGKINITWKGFTLQVVPPPVRDLSDLTNALVNSLTIAVLTHADRASSAR